MWTGRSLHNLFATILLFSRVNYPDNFWNSFKHEICNDMPYRLHKIGVTNFTEEKVYDYGLYLLNQIIEEAGKSLTDFPSMSHFNIQLGCYNNKLSNCQAIELEPRKQMIISEYTN